MNKTRIIMVLVAIALTVSVASATDWQQFQKNDTNYAVSSAEAIAGAGGPTGVWSRSIGGFGASPIAHGGYVYASNGNGLHKYTYDGVLQTGWPPAGGGNFYGSSAYGNGTGRIFYYGSFAGKSIKSVNENDPTDIWTATPPGAAGDTIGIFKSGITYAINKTGTKSIYFGDFGDRFYCYDVGGANFALRWTYVGAGAQFWHSASAIGDYVVFGKDGGTITCLKESDGTYVDSINLAIVRGSMSWNAINDTYGYLFLVSSSGVRKVGFNTTTGQFGAINTSNVGYSETTAPVVYDGKVYASVSNRICCYHESNLTNIWCTSPLPTSFRVQASPALATRDGHVYAYVTANGVGGVICVNCSSHAVEWTDTTVGTYSMQGVAIAENDTGTWIFATSQGSGKLAGHWQKDPPPRKPDLNVTAIETSALYAGTYNIVEATIINGGNASVGGFNATLAAGTTVVDEREVGMIGAGESTVVKFVWAPTATGTPTLNVTVDSGGVVSEWDETNNSMTKGVTVSPILATDLAVIEVNSCDLANGEENTVFAVIENKGADASGFNLTLLNGTAVVDTVFVPMLHFRDSQLVAFNWTPTTAGTANLNVTIEDGGYKTQTVTVKTFAVTNVASGSSIQAAIDGGTGDRKIIVGTGVYNETISIPAGKSGIRLIASGSDVVICNNTADIITIEGTDCYVEGFTINSTIIPTGYANWPGAGINVTPAARWNVIEKNYIYNTSSGIKLHGGKNLIRCNTVGESAKDRVCLCQMAISGDCNAIVKNTFDGDTADHTDYGWILGGTFTADGVTVTGDAFNNTVRGNNFTMTGGAGWAPGDILFGGDPNMVFDNIVNDTGSNVVELGELNWYNVTKVAVEDPTMGNVVHGTYYGGNYWAGYTGSDSDYDLLGDTDTPYRGVDNHPLVRAKCGDVNRDGEVTIADAQKIYGSLGGSVELCNPWAADVNNCDGEVTIADAQKIYGSLGGSVELHCCCGGT